MQYVTTSDGVRIAYVSLGDGPPLVWASNIFGEANGYRVGFPHVKEVTDRLLRLGWRVIRYDVRGMGLSERDVSDRLVGDLLRAGADKRVAVIWSGADRVRTAVVGRAAFGSGKRTDTSRCAGLAAGRDRIERIRKSPAISESPCPPSNGTC